MTTRKHRRRRTVLTAVGTLVTTGIALLWVAAAGGWITVTTTAGSSMAPSLHQGDLAIVRRSSNYELGDVVAYRSRILDTVVLHRITAVHDGRFTLRGDNNSWFDADHPAEGQVLGELWLHVPRVGAVRDIFRIPIILAGLALTAGGIVLFRGHRRKGTAHTMSAPSGSPLHVWRGAAVGLAVASAVCLAIAAVAWRTPTTRTISGVIAHTQSGRFTYHAATPSGPVYERGGLRTGDPVYTRLVPRLDVAFDYTFSAPRSTAITGTIALVAEIADGTGWRQRITLQPTAPFSGRRVTATGQLAVAELYDRVAQVQSATGVRGGQPSVTLLPVVHLTTAVQGSRIAARFSPDLRFQMEPLQLRLADARAGKAPELRPVSRGTVSRSEDAARAFVVLGRSIPVANARRVGLLAPFTALATLAAAAVLRRRLRAETARIALRHGHRIVPVANADRDAHVAFVDVTTMADLARLAEQADTLILHQRTDNGDVYLFQTDRTVYRYTATASGRQLARATA